MTVNENTNDTERMKIKIILITLIVCTSILGIIENVTARNCINGVQTGGWGKNDGTCVEKPQPGK